MIEGPHAKDAGFTFGPWAVVAVLLTIYLGVTLVRAGGDPLVFATISGGFADGAPLDPADQGYDGQFAYFIALDPSPESLEGRLDVPAYRYQRILYPLTARLAGFAQASLIPWTLVLVNLLAHVVATALLGRWLVAHGVSAWYALTYGLWVGLVIPVRGDLTEPLAYALVVAAFWAQQRGRQAWAAACLGLALFAKETTVLFLAAQVAAAVFAREWRRALVFSAPLVPYAAFQAWLLATFGSTGLGSGGFMATGFEFVPFMGLWRVAEVGLVFLVGYVVFMGPLVVWPSVWGMAASAARLWTTQASPVVWALAANALLIPFTPFSTFREPFGMLRLADGLVLATVLFAAHDRRPRVLNLSLLWIAALALALQS